MAGVFACPECGEELEVEGLSPGREILCDWCSTLVEVPYFPRGTGSRSTSRQPSPRSPWNSLLLKGAIGFAVMAMLGLLVSRLIVGRVRSDQEKVLAELVDSAEKAEGNRRFDVALFQIEAALAQGRSMGLKDSSRLDELKERRDRIIVREVEDRLANIDTLGPDQAVGEALTLVEKAEKNPALASLAGTIEAKLASLRLFQAEADLAAARKAFEADRDVEAFAVAERLHDRAGDLSRSDASRFQAEARSLLEATVGRRGVALPPVVGRFVAGSTEAYTKILDRPRAESLRSKGYLPQPSKSAWSQLWDDKAPFRATVQIVETQEEYYLQSKNRTTRVDGTFELFRGDQLLWKNRVVARTRVPLPDLPALLGGHIATSDRNPETERRLHDDAMKQFVEQASKNLRGSPSRETVLKIR